MSQKVAAIIGAGPAGLTAAVELLRRTDAKPIVLEQSAAFGGLSQTVNHRGNRMDIGGHRFFSKSDRVVDWWLERLPLQRTIDAGQGEGGLARAEVEPGPDPDLTDRVMLVRSRKSRIYWRRRLFDYPLSLSADTIRKMGLWRMSRAGLSYLRSVARPIRPEVSLQDFFINRFGRELYRTFFQTYTEKVWGAPCNQIPATWGQQRVKGLSIRKAIWHALTTGARHGAGVSQKGTETSLIEQFMYPKYGPGQMWETAAEEVRCRGGEVRMNHRVVGLSVEGGRIVEVEAVDTASGGRVRLPCDYLLSSMPVRDLVRALGDAVPTAARRIAEGLVYRDFLTVGLLVEKMTLKDDRDDAVRDNWIYIQEPDVSVGRLQIFNNWSPYMVADASKTWLGLEYFCNEGDELWSRSDADLIGLGADELARIGIIDPTSVLDGCVARMLKAYPAYFGSYGRFAELRSFLDGVPNLYCLGRNGQHRYNNQDHSMLTAMIAVDNIVAGCEDKSNLWDVNTEEEYHETRR